VRRRAGRVLPQPRYLQPRCAAAATAADYAAVAEHSSPDEVGALVSLIVAINAWNAISVATRAWQPGSYVPA